MEFVLIFGLIILIIIIASIKHIMESSVHDLKDEYNIQDGDIEYSDLDKPTHALFSKKIRLVGKPDYIVKQGEEYIPVEVKKGNYDNPFQSHIMQLIAYCYLVEEEYDVKVRHGILVYDHNKIEIKYTKKLKEELLETIDLMRRRNEFHRSHNQVSKCKSCSFNYVCDEKLSG